MRGMTNCELAGIVGACLSFGGGAILSWDALTVVRGTKAGTGAEQFFKVKEKLGVKVTVCDKDGKAYDSAADVHVGVAQRKLRLTLIGFSVMALGFLVDLVAKMSCVS